MSSLIVPVARPRRHAKISLFVYYYHEHDINLVLLHSPPCYIAEIITTVTTSITTTVTTTVIITDTAYSCLINHYYYYHHYIRPQLLLPPPQVMLLPLVTPSTTTATSTTYHHSERPTLPSQLPRLQSHHSPRNLIMYCQSAFRSDLSQKFHDFLLK